MLLRLAIWTSNKSRYCRRGEYDALFCLARTPKLIQSIPIYAYREWNVHCMGREKSLHRMIDLSTLRQRSFPGRHCIVTALP
jgi:hypothetical protein